jgi:ATP-binding cassette, subfamily B, bacterial
MRLSPLHSLSKGPVILLQMVKLAWEAYPTGVASVVLLNLVQGLIPVLVAWITKLIFDQLVQVIQVQRDQPSPSGFLGFFPQTLLVLLALQATMLILASVLMHLSTFLNAESGRKLHMKVQSTIFRKINSLQGLAPFEDPRSYDAFRLAAEGAIRGPSDALKTTMYLLQNAVTLIGVLSILLPFSPPLAGAVCLTILPRMYAYIRMGRQRFNLAVSTSPNERRAFYYEHILSNVEYAKELRLFNLADYFMGAFLDTFKRVHQLQRAQQKRETGWHIALEVVSGFVAAIAFALVVLQAFAQRISVGDVTLYTSAVTSIQTSMIAITAGLANMSQNVLFYSRYTKLMELPEPLQLNITPQPVSLLKSGVELRNVSFRYSNEQPWILRNINLHIPAGRCLALVGLNGAGKTTLAKLLTRMYDPTEGNILWDGVDTRSFSPQELRQHISAIFQDFLHYDLTAQENIGLGNVASLHDNDRVMLAARRAGIHERLVTLPKGYQTVLSRWLTATDNDAEGQDQSMTSGIDLSGGEWQKVALARMFMRECDLLILDEPTAALDVQAEYELYSRFVELMVGRTSLLITHRFSTIQMADIVAVLEDGTVVESGSHEELVLQGGTYAKLYTTQAQYYQTCQTASEAGRL